MKKMVIGLVLALALFIGASALADGPVLMVELPENAAMVENFEFEDGDFVQTYQIPGGVTVQILRYAAFDMTLEELMEGEWAGYTAAEKLDMDSIDGYPAQGMHLTYVQESEGSGQEMSVYTMMLEVQKQKLIFQAVFPKSLGDARIEADMQTWMDSMTVSGAEDREVG